MDNIRNARIEVFRDTLKWIKDDETLASSVEASLKNTEIFYDNNYPPYNSDITYDTEINVSGDRTFQAALRLKKENPDSKVAVLNFANAFHPGGGVDVGAGAQEESLCRCSTLYPVIACEYMQENFYEYHKENGSLRATDSLIYSEEIIVCKTDELIPKRMPKGEWTKVDVITAAAPNMSYRSNRRPNLPDSTLHMSYAEQFGIHVRRAIHILTVAASKNAYILVLGAFGCGAFHNNPQAVANAYKVALDVFPKVFKRVEFAVFCPEEGSENFDTFRESFKALSY